MSAWLPGTATEPSLVLQVACVPLVRRKLVVLKALTPKGRLSEDHCSLLTGSCLCFLSISPPEHRTQQMQPVQAPPGRQAGAGAGKAATRQPAAPSRTSSSGSTEQSAAAREDVGRRSSSGAGLTRHPSGARRSLTGGRQDSKPVTLDGPPGRRSSGSGALARQASGSRQASALDTGSGGSGSGAGAAGAAGDDDWLDLLGGTSSPAASASRQPAAATAGGAGSAAARQSLPARAVSGGRLPGRAPLSRQVTLPVASGRHDAMAGSNAQPRGSAGSEAAPGGLSAAGRGRPPGRDTAAGEAAPTRSEEDSAQPTDTRAEAADPQRSSAAQAGRSTGTAAASNDAAGVLQTKLPAAKLEPAGASQPAATQEAGDSGSSSAHSSSGLSSRPSHQGLFGERPGRFAPPAGGAAGTPAAKLFELPVRPTHRDLLGGRGRAAAAAAQPAEPDSARGPLLDAQQQGSPAQAGSGAAVPGAPTEEVEEHVPPTLQGLAQPLAPVQAGLGNELGSSQQPEQAVALQQEVPAEEQGRQAALPVKDTSRRPAEEVLKTAPGKPLQCRLACNRGFRWLLTYHGGQTSK